MDEIRIDGIHALGRHGAYPGEKDAPQPFVVAVRLDADLGAAARSDRLEDTLDYAALHRTVVDIVERTSFDLLERLAAEIAGALLADTRIAGVDVTVAKPRLLAGATASVTLRRSR